MAKTNRLCRLGRLVGIGLFGLMLTVVTVHAQTVNVYEWLQVKAPVEKVWEKIGGFCDLTAFLSIVTKCEMAGDGGVGSIRYLELKIGDDTLTVDEPLVALGKHSYTYIMSKGFLAEARYRSTLRVMPATEPGTSIVDWTGQIDSQAYPDDKGAEMAKTLHGAYKTGLEGIKKLVE